MPQSVIPYMEQYAARFPAATEAEYPVTSDGLVKHFQKYGLDNSHSGYKGKAETYSNYKALRQDCLVLVARTYFAEDTYIQILDVIGYGQYAEQGRADWKEMRDEQDQA